MRAFAPVALFLGAFATLAAAQGGDTPTATSPADAAQTSALSAMVACIAACPAGDVDCQAKCITVSVPSCPRLCPVPRALECLGRAMGTSRYAPHAETTRLTDTTGPVPVPAAGKQHHRLRGQVPPGHGLGGRQPQLPQLCRRLHCPLLLHPVAGHAEPDWWRRLRLWLGFWWLWWLRFWHRDDDGRRGYQHVRFCWRRRCCQGCRWIGFRYARFYGCPASYLVWR